MNKEIVTILVYPRTSIKKELFPNINASIRKETRCALSKSLNERSIIRVEIGIKDNKLYCSDWPYNTDRFIQAMCVRYEYQLDQNLVCTTKNLEERVCYSTVTYLSGEFSYKETLKKLGEVTVEVQVAGIVFQQNSIIEQRFKAMIVLNKLRGNND